VIVVAAAVTVPLLLLRGDDSPSTTRTTVARTTSTTRPPASSSTTGASTTATTPATTSASTTTSTGEIAGAPGDSEGRWVETWVPEMPDGAYAVALSDKALVVEVNTGSGYALYAYPLGSDVVVKLPVEGTASPDADIDGDLVVWREGREEESAYDYVDTSLAAYLLPSGPKIEVARGETTIALPQVAGGRVTWTEHEPSDFEPDQYWNQHVYMMEVDATGAPTGSRAELVSSATADKFGDLAWTYSLSDSYVAWENATPHRTFEAGTYAVGLDPLGMPLKVGGEAWLPSVAGPMVAYWDDGLQATDLATAKTWQIDPLGDYPTAAPTYVAYFRSGEQTDQLEYEIVARGYSGTYEQVLGTTPMDPYFLARIAAAGTHIAFILDSAVRLFEWQGTR